jgi:hypothetical protein
MNGELRVLVVLALLPLGLSQTQARDNADEKAFFESKVRPLLVARCFKCHSAESPKPKGGLRLDSREAILKGGNAGPALVPGNPEKSLLLAAAKWADPDLRMPPKERLPEGEVEILSQWIRKGAPWVEGKAAPARKEREITEADKAYWSFRPVANPPLPPVQRRDWVRNEIDSFILHRLETEGLSPAPEADRRTLIRRLSFDLHGLPPSPEEVDAFVADPAPDAYEKLIDRLLASPRYGARWARHWLDLVRYSESDGYRQDAFRPNVWPYRDYVIRSLNEDKPYDRFVTEQLAGDELAPDDPNVRVATTFLRLGMYEWNQRDVVRQWADVLNDLTDVTGDVFLGLGMGCARCHDHKFDPILRSDYYRLQAFFTPILWRDDLTLASPKEQADHRTALHGWEQKTEAVRGEIAKIERPFLEKAERDAIERFVPEIREMIRKPVAGRTPLEHQIAELAFRQVVTDRAQIDGKIKGAQREEWSKLKRRLAEFDEFRPKPLPAAFVAADAGPLAPPTSIPGEKREIQPGPLTVLAAFPIQISALPDSTGRRTALARWITRPDHPLTARVMVNRIWQSHFGRGLVATSSDFGHLGDRPSHPELLDRLASRFIAGGWRLKDLHRLILGSAAYRQSSVPADLARGHLKDPENRLLWKGNTRRLDAEQIRDAMLAASGELDPAAGGPSADPSSPRRTIYTQALRNTRDPLIDAFDAPDAFASAAGRNVTTTATQALLLINGAWPLQRADAFAKRVGKESSPEERIERAYRFAFGRCPRSDERDEALAFLGTTPGERRLAPVESPLVQATPHRGGQSVRIRGAEIEDRLRLPDSPSLPSGDFTIEAIVLLDSLYEDAAVRVIASQWKGKVEEAGWSFGVTSLKSKHEPRNLILQLVGEEGYEVIPSDLRVELHKAHYVAASVRIRETGESGITFYLKDLTDPEAPLRTASVRHKVSGRYRSNAAVVVGGRDGPASHGWDGLIDELRLSNVALSREQLLIHDGDARAAVAHWKFEPEPGVLLDSSGHQPPLTRTSRPAAPRTASPALVDFCHVLLNSNEFLYVD